MKYRFEESFSLVKHDTLWVKKTLIAGSLALAAVFLFLIPPIIAIASKMFNIAVFIEIGICWLISAVLTLAVSGFCIKTGHDRIFDRCAQLPEWCDFWSFVFLGFKSALGSLLFFLPVLAVGVGMGVFKAVAKLHGASDTGASFVAESVYNIVYFLFIFFYFAFNANFVKDYNVFSYINFPAVYRMLKVKENFINYLILVGLILALGFVFNFGAFLLCLTIVGILALPFGGLYVQLVSMDFTAQFIRLTENEQ